MCIRSRAVLTACVAFAACSSLSTACRELLAQNLRVPVAEQRYEERQQTVYRPEYVTEMKDVYRTVYTPVTQYHWEARWHPFQSPNWAWHAVPHVQWQMRTEKSRVPVTSQHYVAEKRTVKVPYMALRFQEQPAATAVAGRSAPPASLSPSGASPTTTAGAAAANVASSPASSSATAAASAPAHAGPGSSSVPAGPAATTPAANVANRLGVGGILRMDNDPPRHGRLTAGGTVLR